MVKLDETASVFGTMIGGFATENLVTNNDGQVAQISGMDEIIGQFQRILQEQRNIKVQFEELLVRLDGNVKEPSNQKESRLDTVLPEGHLAVLDLIGQHMAEEHDALIHIYERFQALI